MPATAATAALALLVLYGAALIFLLQTVSDHYSPVIFGPLLRKSALPWAVVLVVIALAAFTVSGFPQTVWADPVAGALLLAAMVAAAMACYKTWTTGTDRRRIVGLISGLPSDHRQSTTRQVLWTALARGDVETVRLALRLFRRGTTDWEDLITWLLGHHLVRDRDWLESEVLSALLDGGLDAEAAQAVNTPLQALLREVLDHEDFDAAYAVVDQTMTVLRKARPFTNPHGQVMCDLARTLWLIGDYRGDAPRAVRIPSQLGNMKSIYGVRRRAIWQSLVRQSDAAGSDAFVAFLCIAIQDTDAASSAFPLVFDIIADGMRAGVLSQQSIFELASMVGWHRRRAADSTGDCGLPADEWGSLVADLAYALLAVGASDDDIDHMLTNAGPLPRGKQLTVSRGLGELDEALLARLDKILGKQPRYKVAANGEIAPERPTKR